MAELALVLKNVYHSSRLTVSNFEQQMASREKVPGRTQDRFSEDIETPVAHMACSVIPQDGFGIVSIAWLADDDSGCKFAQSLNNIAPEQLGDALATFAFVTMENLFMSPPWWDELAAPVRQQKSAKASWNT